VQISPNGIRSIEKVIFVPVINITNNKGIKDSNKLITDENTLDIG
jgi:hypothetical protein